MTGKDSEVHTIESLALVGRNAASVTTGSRRVVIDAVAASRREVIAVASPGVVDQAVASLNGVESDSLAVGTPSILFVGKEQGDAGNAGMIGDVNGLHLAGAADTFVDLDAQSETALDEGKGGVESRKLHFEGSIE